MGSDLDKRSRFEDILSSAVDRQIDREQALQETLGGIRDAVGELNSAVAGAAEDVRALASAMLDLNSGLREWANTLEGRIGSLANTMYEGIRELAETQQEALRSFGKTLGSTTSGLSSEVGGLIRETATTLGSRLDGLAERLVEAGELTSYLRDQAEDMDRALAGLGDVPRKLEGVVAQALRRALTVRAGLVREAEKALGEALDPVEGRVERLVEALGGLPKRGGRSPVEDAIKQVTLGQAELGSRLDALERSIQALGAPQPPPAAPAAKTKPPTAAPAAKTKPPTAAPAAKTKLSAVPAGATKASKMPAVPGKKAAPKRAATAQTKVPAPSKPSAVSKTKPTKSPRAAKAKRGGAARKRASKSAVTKPSPRPSAKAGEPKPNERGVKRAVGPKIEPSAVAPDVERVPAAEAAPRRPRRSRRNYIPV